LAVLVGFGSKWLLRSGASAVLTFAACALGVFVGPYLFSLAGVAPVLVVEDVDVVAGLVGAALFAVAMRLIGGRGGL
jgi:hypothetical protein